MNKDKKAIYSWALYDWANSAFSTTVMAGFFPIFFKKYYASELSVSESTALLGVTSSIITLLIVLTAPFFGILSDSALLKKKLLFGFSLLGALATTALAFVDSGNAHLACIVYGAASFFHASSAAPYDALLLSVSSQKQSERVSSLGYALGYLGGGLLFVLNIIMYMKPDWFFLKDASAAIKASFVSVSVWWIFFTVPLMIFVRERPNHLLLDKKSSIGKVVFKNFSKLRDSFTSLRQHKQVLLFLVAFFLYNDALGTVVKMAVDFGLSIGFPANSLMLALLLVQFVGFPATIFLGRVAERYHPKRGILVGIGIYVFVLTWACFMNAVWEFYAIAALIGCAQGGVQALSRSYYVRLIPQNKSGEFFGFYNLLGKFTGFLGPLFVGASAYLSGHSRYSLFVVNLLFLPGALLLLRVKEGKNKE
jgi:UMF1 family MFS transporter